MKFTIISKLEALFSLVYSWWITY